MDAESARKLEDRIRDHLLAEGFRDDLMFARTSVTYDGKVMVTLTPFRWNCATCEGKGFFPRLAEAFTQRLRPTWCTDCMATTEIRWDRTEALTPRLKAVLDRAFATEFVTPDSPFSSIVVTG